MKLRQLIAIAAEGYSENLPLGYFDDPNGEHGDTLAEFIMKEIVDTFEEDESDLKQLAEARRVLRNAIAELKDVVRALDCLSGYRVTELCDTCMRSGVEIARTVDGKTVCVECDI